VQQSFNNKNFFSFGQRERIKGAFEKEIIEIPMKFKEIFCSILPPK